MALRLRVGQAPCDTPFDPAAALRFIDVMPRSVRCPICHQECAWDDNPARPFCSERCRMIDLGNWLGERYRVPGALAGDESEGGSETDDE
jgi:endogenous inhibitor of DNA gyrase (YacG/DUF329 family)